MSEARLWHIGGALGFVLVIVIGWFLVVSPTLQQVADNDSMRASVAAQNAQLEAEVAAMSAVDIGDLRAEIAEFARAVPPALSSEPLIREWKGIVENAGATPVSVTLSARSPFLPGGPGIPADGAPPEFALPIPDAILEAAVAAGLQYSTVTIVLDGELEAATRIADELQRESSRRFLISTLSVTDEDVARATLSGVVWVLPAA